MSWKNERGQRLVRHVVVRVVLPEGHPEQRRTFTPPGPRSGYNPDQVDQIATLVVDWLDKTYPYWEFRYVKVGEDAFNFIYAGLRERSEPTVINPPAPATSASPDGKLPEVPDAG